MSREQENKERGASRRNIMNLEEVRFSDGYPREQGIKDLSDLLQLDKEKQQVEVKNNNESTNEGSGEKIGFTWNVSGDAKGVERIIKFKTFKTTWEFMNLVAAEAAKKKHHPEWSNIYNTVFMRWTTHSPEGLSQRDVLMARFCDEKAKELGEIKTKKNDQENVEVEKDLIDKIENMARNCCISKKS